MRTLYFDCFSGISGDMTVGALRDLGVQEEVFSRALSALGLGGEFETAFRRDSRRNIAGWKFDVTPAAKPVARKHQFVLSQAHADHEHGRSFADIRQLLQESTLSDFIKTRATAVFHRIAVAEGKIHGFAPEEVSFHEVGAIDSIADIVAVCAGIEALKVDRIVASSLVEGSGFVDCAHGRFPLPAPATLEILSGIPVRQLDEPHELITPTGAAILAEFVTAFGPLPEIRVEKIGYGLGTRDTVPRPNVLRAVLGESDANAETDEIVQIDCNIDDLSPEILGGVMDRLFAAGALDVFFTPAQMKKNRPGTLVTVLGEEAKVPELSRILLTETTSFGVRMHRVQRLKLRREFCEVDTPYGPIRMKLGYLGAARVQASPEYDSCRAAAEKASASVKDVYFAAICHFRT